MQKKLLLVISDTATLAAWKQSAASADIELDIALSGAEGLGRAALGLPDYIIIGPMEIAAEVFVRSLQQDPRTAHIPLLTVSAHELSVPDTLMARVRMALSPRRILIAEDDRQMSSIVEMMLTKSGYEVRVVFDGMEALREIRDWHPHLVVLDIMLPVVDGFHVCQTLNEDHSYEPRPRILIVSGRSSEWDQNLGVACGAEDYVVKPFNNAVFVEKVRSILQQ